ncbi:hypothetical protein Tco_1036727 [Tanacetum coccineum]
MVLGASVYFIWQERNVRLFENKFRTVDVVFNLIVNIVRLKLLSLNVKWSWDVGIAANIWCLPRLVLKGTYGFIDDMDIDDSDSVLVMIAIKKEWSLESGPVLVTLVM